MNPPYPPVEIPSRSGHHSALSRAPCAMLLLLLSLQACPTLCSPRDGSPPAPPSLGFPRQEHRRGMPVPSPMQESEKWKGSHLVMSDSSRPHGLQPTRLLHPGDFPGKGTGVGCHFLLHCAMQYGIKKRWYIYTMKYYSASRLVLIQLLPDRGWNSTFQFFKLVSDWFSSQSPLEPHDGNLC